MKARGLKYALHESVHRGLRTSRKNIVFNFNCKFILKACRCNCNITRAEVTEQINVPTIMS